MKNKMNIAIVEDDALTALFLTETLEDLGHTVLGSFDSAQPLFTMLEESTVDLVLMDIEINGKLDGIQCAQTVYNKHNIRSIFITSYQNSATIHDAMDVSPLGYLIKPVSEPDIEAALALASRSIRTAPVEEETFKCSGKYAFYPEYNTLKFEGSVIKLGKNELKLVELLFKRCNNIVNTEEIKKCVWDDDNYNDESLRQLIYRVRKKLPELNIVSSSKIGYLIECV